MYLTAGKATLNKTGGKHFEDPSAAADTNVGTIEELKKTIEEMESQISDEDKRTKTSVPRTESIDVSKISASMKSQGEPVGTLPQKTCRRSSYNKVPSNTAGDHGCFYS